MPHIRIGLMLHYFYRRLRVRATWNLLCISCSVQDTDDDNTTRESPEPPEVAAWRTLNRWLATNKTFSIQGTNLEAWFSPSRSFSFIFQVLDSRVAYVLLALWILLTFSPAIICFIEARSKLPIVFAIPRSAFLRSSGTSNYMRTLLLLYVPRPLPRCYANIPRKYGGYCYKI
jgi:hypothetical protein